jgi:hypothetical protein
MTAGPPDDVTALLRQPGDAHGLAKEDAVCRLVSLGRDRVELTLVPMVESATTSPLVRTNGARVLRLFQLVRALGHVRGATRERAVVELARLGAPARIALGLAARSADPVVRANARRALHLMTEPGACPPDSSFPTGGGISKPARGAVSVPERREGA